MAAGASVYAVALAFACGVISSVDYPSQLYGRTLELLNEFMRVRCLPQPLRMKVREHFARAYPRKRFFNSGTQRSLPVTPRADCATLAAITKG